MVMSGVTGNSHMTARMSTINTTPTRITTTSVHTSAATWSDTSGSHRVGHGWGGVSMNIRRQG